MNSKTKKPAFLKKPPLAGGLFCREAGNVLLYVLIAVALLAALTFAFARGNRDNLSQQKGVSMAEDLFVQANMIRAAVQQCVLEYPKGGGDIAPAGAPDGVIDASDNPNNPYPLAPSDALNPFAPAGIAAAADDRAKYLTCVGASAAEARMFEGSSNQGRFLPPIPAGFSEWVYKNDGTGVYIQTAGSNDGAAKKALDLLERKFDSCQVSRAGGCGLSQPNCFTIFIVKAAGCP